jgi:uncharacterized ferritin-like protein (DUF455 family)
MINEPTGLPGRPEQPELVPPFQVRQRSIQTVQGRAALIHALAHIEFNAINLALDVIWRYPGLPEAFYREWLGVAAEEAKHFLLLAAHLQTLNMRYGDLPAHNGLWEMAARTKADLLARIALVPRTLEARGLDASLPIRNKLLEAGDHAGAAILDIILRDEIGHVAIGNRWYRWLCAQRGLEPVKTFASLALAYQAPVLRPPFNFEARLAAGFDPAELQALQNAAEAAQGLSKGHAKPAAAPASRPAPKRQ